MIYSTIPTQVGAAKLRNASLLGQTVNITRIAFGDGNGAEYEPTGQETELKNQVYECPPNRIEEEPTSPSWIELEAVIPSNVGGWYLREVGCYDDAGDLIFIGNLPSSFKPSGEAGVIKDLVFEMVYDAVAADVVTIKINPNVVIATRKYVGDEFQKHVDSDDPHEQYLKSESHLDETKDPHKQYPLVEKTQYLPYDLNRVYSLGEVCYTKAENGKVTYWEWYSNVESLAGKDPLNTANRRIGWTDVTKPFYWKPYMPKVAGETMYWDTDTIPENMVVGIGQQLPVAVYHSLATAKPEWIDATDNTLINIPDRQGRFVRAADGASWLAGEVHDDAIRNITGTIGRIINVGATEYSGSLFWSGFQSSVPIGESSGASSSRYAYFDASLVVPTAAENQPKAFIEWVGYAL